MAARSEPNDDVEPSPKKEDEDEDEDSRLVPSPPRVELRPPRMRCPTTAAALRGSGNR